MRGTRLCLHLLALWLVAALVIAPSPTWAAPTQLNAYRSTEIPVIDGVIADGEWSDMPVFNETVSGVRMAFKHDAENLYILVVIARSSPSDRIYFGIEFDNNGDGAHMGTSSNPDDALFISPAFTPNNARDAFLEGFASPVYDERVGGVNNVEGKIAYQDGRYIIEMRRPLATGDTKGWDVNLSQGSTVAVGFARGEFGTGAEHASTDMRTYTLTISDERYIGQEIELDPSTLIVLAVKGWLRPLVEAGVFFTLALGLLQMVKSRRQELARKDGGVNG